GHQHEVAGEYEVGPTAGRGAVHRRDHGLLAVEDRCDEPLPAALDHAGDIAEGTVGGLGGTRGSRLLRTAESGSGAGVTFAGAGAGRGSGVAEALLLAGEGAAVVVNDLGGTPDGTGADTSAAQQVVDEIVAAGGRAAANHGSVMSWDDSKGLVDQAIDVFGGL